jgi:hypothetical protein
MESNNNQNNRKENFENNSFIDAKEEAEDGKVSKKPNSKAQENSEKEAEDNLFRAKNAEKELTTESDKYRRDNS